MTDKRAATTKRLAFSQEVHQQAFALWYKLGRPEYKQVVQIMQEEAGEGVRSPTIHSIMIWHKSEDWEEHADALDGQAEQAGDLVIIKQRQDIIGLGGLLCRIKYRYQRRTREKAEEIHGRRTHRGDSHKCNRTRRYGKT